MEIENIRTDIPVSHDSQRLTFYDCDYKNRIKISTILKMTAELSGKDYTDKGLGHKVLWDNGYVFLLSKISIHINDYPIPQQIIDSSTWECGKKGALFLRAYDMRINGSVWIDGTSGWIVVNPLSRKIIRPASFPWPMPQLEDRAVKALPIDKISAENAVFAGEHIVQISDIDANGHVYNANYADIAVNFLPLEIYEKDIENFRINFVNEAKFGDTIKVYTEISSACAKIIGKLSDKECFETEFIFK